MKKVLIFGSCVTRDPFENSIASGLGFEIKDYYARSSFASLAGKPVLNQDLSKISSSFQRKMVEKDFSKNFLDYDFSSIDLILFDFIDDRFPLLELPDGACCTESNEFKKSELDFDAKKIDPFSSNFFDRWEKGWVIVLNKLKCANVINLVKINKVFLAKQDNLGIYFSGQEYIEKMNAWLSKIYDRLSLDLSVDQFCDYKEISFVGDAGHKWGRSPFHFKKSIEKYFIKFLSGQSFANHTLNKSKMLQTEKYKLTSNPDANGIVHGNGKFGAKIYFSIDEAGFLNIVVNTEVNSTGLDFCYYVIRNNFHMHTEPYQKGKNKFGFKLVQAANYSVRVFIKNHGEHFSHSDSYTMDSLQWFPSDYIKISIIIPAYNREKVIKHCLGSIYNQTMEKNEYEIIVVDDCSVDNTPEIVTEYSKIHQNTKLIRLPKNTGGASIPRNVGLDYAKGEYIFFLDSDYEITKNTMLSDAHHLCKEQNLDLCLIYGYRNVPEALPRPIGKYRMRRPIMDCLNIMKRDSLAKVNPRFYDFMGIEDVAFTLQFIFNSENFRANCLPGKLIVEIRELRQGSPRSNEKWREMIEALVDVSFAQLARKPHLADGIYYAFAALVGSLPHIEMKYRQAEGVSVEVPQISMNYVSQTVLNFLSAYLNYRVPAGTEDCLEPIACELFKILRSGDREKIIGKFSTL